MFARFKDIEIRPNDFENLKLYLREALDKVKNEEISHAEFVSSVESCFSEGPLSLENVILLRTAKQPHYGDAFLITHDD